MPRNFFRPIRGFFVREKGRDKTFRTNLGDVIGRIAPEDSPVRSVLSTGVKYPLEIDINYAWVRRSLPLTQSETPRPTTYEYRESLLPNRPVSRITMRHFW